MKNHPHKNAALNLASLWILPFLCGVLMMSYSAKAASATWLASPFNNNWIAAPTTNNWSTGPGTFPGNTAGGGTTDVATFSAASSITTINCASGFAIGGITFDTASASAYTINTSGGTWRLNTGNATIRVTSTVVNPQRITGSLRMQSSGTLYVINDSTTPSATLTISTGISVNNSGSAGRLILGGTNTGPNILGSFSEQAFATAPGSLIKTNNGTWVLTGNCTHHNDTLILGGTLMLMGAGAIPNSPNIIVSGGTLNVSNTLTTANNLFVTNSGALLLTNTFFRTPLTVGALSISNATLRLGVNGSTSFTNIVVTSSLDSGPGIAINIEQTANVVAETTFAVISYQGTDPDPAIFTVSVPSGFSAGAVMVDTVNKLVTVTVTPSAVASSLVWVGATNSLLVSSWDTVTKNWVDAATLTLKQAYADPDAVTFNDAASNNIVTLNTTVSPFGVVVSNNILNYTINGPGKISGAFGLTKIGNATLTLAETGGDNFTGGVTVNGGTLILDNTNSAIAGGLTIANGATAQIGKNDANGALPLGSVNVDGGLIFSRSNNLLVSAAIAGAGSLSQNGNGILSLSASNSYTGVTVASKGTLALTGAGSIVTSAGLSVSNATFDVSALANRTTFLSDLNITNAIINVGPTNLSASVSVNTFEADGITGKSNIINVLALPPMASYPSTITLVQSANPITLTGGNFNFALGSLPAGSPSFAGALSESADNTSILLTLTAGPTGNRPSVTWNATNNVSANTNWSDNVNWRLPGVPVSTDNIFFDGNTTVGDNATVNNVVDTSFGITTLTYNQTTSGQWHNTLIPAGSVLTVSGATGVGTGTAAGSTTSVTFSGPGEFDANGAFNLNSAGGGSDSHENVDMSGLSTFKNNAPAATMALGTAAQTIVNFNLASNSFINVATLNIQATGGANGRAGTLNLGVVTNTIYANNINLSTGKGQTTKIQFGANAPDGTVTIGGTGGGSARANMLLGNGTSGSAVCNGQLLLAGHLANVLAGTVTLGGVGGSTGDGDMGTVTFDNGTFDVMSLLMGSSTSAHSSSGTFTVGGDVGHTATLIVGSGGVGSLVLGNASISGGTGAGTLNINVNGIANINCNITKNTASGAANTATINVTDGTLKILSGTAGTIATPIDNLNLSDNGSLDTILQLNVTAGGPAIAAAAISASGTTTINISSIAGVIGTAQIPIISYNNGSSPYGGLTLGTIPSGYSGASLVDNTGNQSIDLLITSPAPLVWKGAVNSLWDTSTLNWLNGVTAVAYADGNFVQLDDSASTGMVTLATTVLSPGINVTNNSRTYTFNGTGRISGTGSLVKQGPGLLVLANSGTNDFTGGVNLIGGTLQVGNNDTNGMVPAGNLADNGTLAFLRSDDLTFSNTISGAGGVSQINTNILTLAGANSYTGPTFIRNGTLKINNTNALGSWDGAPVTITNGGTLDIGGLGAVNINPVFSAKQFYIAGAGVGGNGAIVNNGANNQQNAFQQVALTTNATIGGTTRWDMRNGSPLLNLGGFTLTKTNTNQISLVAVSVTDGNININQGILSFEVNSAVNGTGTITVNSNATLAHFRLASGAMTRPIVINAGAIQNLATTGADSVNDSPITLKANSTLIGSTAANAIILNGIINETSGSFGLTKTGAGAFVMTANNTYSGSTVINAGTLALTGNGSISNSTSIALTTGGSLDVSGLSINPWVLNANQTLSGSGIVTGTVNTVSSATVAPGSASAVGVLNVSGDLTLGGTNVMKLSRTAGATNDVVSTTGALALGGALKVSLLGGSLQNGDTFTLFKSTGGLSGTFAVTNLPVIPGIGWVTTNLANGILSVVVTVNPNPTNITTSVSGNVLTLSWPADHTGWTLQVQTNSLSTGLNTNWFNVPGSTLVNTNVVTINPANGTVFYRMIYP